MSMPYEDIRAEELPAFIREHQPVILDMRDTDTFTKGHIEGALPADETQIRKLMKNRTQPVVLCCYHGHSSRELATLLCQMGMQRVYNLEGGWHAWSAYLNQSPNLPSTQLKQWLQRHGFRHSDNVKQLIHARVDGAMSALMIAAMHGEGSIAEELIELGSDIHAENLDGNQPLWFAAVSADIAILKLILDAGADSDHLNKNGYTTLMFAASTGKLDVVETLLEAGASTDVLNPEGLGALECATTLPVLKRLRAECRTH